MSAYHPELNFTKTCCSSFQGRYLSSIISPSTLRTLVSLTQFEINLPVTLDDQRSFAANIVAATCCRFTLNNRIHLFLSQKVAGSGPGFSHLAPKVLQAGPQISKVLPHCTTPLHTLAWIRFKTLYLPTLWQMAQANRTSKTWSNQAACYILMTKRALPLDKIKTVCCPGSTMVERAPH